MGNGGALPGDRAHMNEWVLYRVVRPAWYAVSAGIEHPGRAGRQDNAYSDFAVFSRARPRDGVLKSGWKRGRR